MTSHSPSLAGRSARLGSTPHGNIVLIVGTCAMAAATLFALTHPSDEAQDVVAVLTMALALGLCGLMCVRREAQRGEILSPLAILAATSFVHFALFGILQCSSAYRFSNSYNYTQLAPAMLFVLLSFTAYWAGYRTASFGSARVATDAPFPFKRQQEATLLLVAIVLISTGWIARIYTISQGGYFKYAYFTSDLSSDLRGIVFLTSSLADLGAAMTALLWLNNRSSLMRGIIPAMLIATNLSYWGLAGMKQELLASALMIFGAWYAFYRRLPSLWVIFTLAFLGITYFSANTSYRAAQEFRAVTDARNISDIAALATDMFDQTSQPSGSSPPLSRLDLTEPVAGAIRIVADGAELRHGKDYLDGLLAIMPRSLWPDKPDIGAIGNAFGHWTGILRNDADRLTSISITWYGEAFLNFGWGGVIVFFAIGAATRMFYRATWETYRLPGIAAYLACLSFLAYLGSSFGITMNSTLKTWLLVVVVFAIARWVSGAITPNHAMLVR